MIKMLAYVERHPVSSVVASIAGLTGGFANAFHFMSQIFGFISGVGGAIITVITIWGMMKTWAKNRAMRELIASQTIPPASAPPATTVTVTTPAP